MGEITKRILVVEDDTKISTILKVNLNMAGYLPECAYDGETGLKMALTGDYDLILLDIMLPLRDGYSICETVRANGLETPIIMVTAKENELDKVLGLDLGADDYVTKPFSIKELLARVKANIRRTHGEKVEIKTKGTKEGVIKIGELTIDTKQFTVEKRNEEIKLSSKEFEVLYFLASNLGQVFSREQLLTEVWGYESYYGDMRTVDITVARLRSKVEDDTQNPMYIKTIRGKGYYMPE